MKKGNAITLSVIFAVLVIGGACTVLVLRNKTLTYEASSVNNSLIPVTNTDSESVLRAQDTDKDGLTDWEEVLWKTDAEKMDSDGDGTSDGDEIKANRNPAIKGPGDTLEEDSLIKKSTLSPTESVARDILIAHYKLTKENVDDPEYSIDALLSKNKPSLTATEYTPDQFQQKADDGASVRNYGIEVATLFNNYLSPNQKNEIEILAEVEKRNEEDIASELKQRGINYGILTAGMLKISVPKSALSIHTSLTNTLSMMSTLTDAMSKIFTDPVTALAGLEKYQETGLLLARDLNNLNLYLQSRGAQFTPQ